MEAIYENSRSEWLQLAEWLEKELHSDWGDLRLKGNQPVWSVATTEISGNEAGFFIFKSRKYLGEKFDALCARTSERLKRLTIPWVIYCYEYRYDGKNWLCSDNPVANISSNGATFAEPVFSHQVNVEIPDASDD